MASGDAAAVLGIYREGMATGPATFQETVPGWEEWDGSHLRSCRLVLADGGRVLGWTALARVSARPVYAGVAELSIYLAEAARGRGLGARLLSELVRVSEGEGFRTLIAGIFPENMASISLHRKLGFREIGRHERLGLMGYGPMAGRWRDVVLLERRRRADP